MNSNILHSLYELSLATGNSLDLKENAAQFTSAWLVQTDFEFASVWIYNSYIDNFTEGLSLITSLPRPLTPKMATLLDAPEIALLESKDFVFVPDSHPSFKEISGQDGPTQGTYALYRLQEMGFLKCYTRNKELEEIEELKIAVNKFAVSIAACLAHLKAINNETRITKIIDSALDAVVLINGEGMVTHWNKQATSMFGWTNEEVIGTDMSKLFIPHRHRSAHNAGMKHYHATGQGPVINKRIEITAINKDGKEFDVELAVVPIKLSDEKTVAFTGFIRDITEAKAAKEALIEARERAEASMKAKEDFLANMSHEIRTPLNAIKGMGELLGYSTLNTTQASYVDAIERSTKNLLVIVNDILDFSKIESGKVAIEKIGFDMKHMLEVLYHSEKTKAFKKGIDFHFEYDERIAPIVISDPVRINQILLNLINNAFKFTSEGYISLKIELLYNTPTLNAVRFLVKDTGIGIDAAKLESIFDEFTQADVSITRRFGGTGLGLAISKKLVGLLDGHISVESKENVGSTFSVVMNFGIGTEEDLPNLTIDQNKVQELKGKSILLVEDHDLNQLLAIAILEELGMKATLAENGQEAVDKMKEGAYDLVLMDMQMPIMDGLEATQIIREELKDITPIVALTANATQQHKDKCLAAGMNDYIAKPFESAILVSKIHALLFGEATAAEKKAATTSLSKPLQKSAKKVSFDISFLERTTRGNKATMQHLLNAFIDKTPPLLLDLKAAIDAKDWDKVRSTAHKMKPSLGILGAKELKDLAQKMEHNAREEQELESFSAQFEQLNVQTLSLIEELKALV